MPASKSKKTKAATTSRNGRAPNQPSLFSFWGKPTKKKTSGSEITAKKPPSDTCSVGAVGIQHNARDEIVTACTGNKRRRVESEDASSSPSTSTTAVVSTTMKQSKNNNNNLKEESHPPINTSVPAVATKTTCLQHFAYREDEVSVEKENNKMPEVCTSRDGLNKKKATMPAEGPKDKQVELTNKKDDHDGDNDVNNSVAEPESKESSTSDSEKEEEDENESQKDDHDNDIPETPTSNNNNQQNPQGLSDYELLRLRNIARNNARLEALGLLPNQDSKPSNPKPKKRASKRPAKKKNNDHPPVTRRSTRRSTRISNPIDGAENADTTTTFTLLKNVQDKSQSSTIAMEEEPSIVYEVSPVVHYEMQQQQQQQKPSSLSEATNDHQCNNEAAAATLVPLNYRLAPPQGLSAIYSLNFYDTTEWIVGAGKAGIIALWNCGQPSSDGNGNDDPLVTNYVDPIVSWKAHGGRWISEAQFLMGDTSQDGAATPSRLVTAGNDGTVCLWDLRQVSAGTGIPKLVYQSNKSWHASGIFAMDVARTTTSTAGTAKIATGSKDKTVAIFNLDRSDAYSSSSTPHWRSYIHSAKVGAVKFRDEHVLATASDDGCVAVLDDRMKDGEGPPVALLENIHQGRPHSVVWQSSSSPVLLTAGLDSVIQAWDIRYLKKESPSPVLEFYGHVPTSTRRCKRIHHPVLYQKKFVLTGGEGSHALSMFEMQQPLATFERRNVDRSAVYSRGSLPDDCCHTDIGSIAVQRDLVAATVDGEVLLLRPSS